MAKDEEKPCPEIFTCQKLEFSAKLVEKMTYLTIFLVEFFFVFHEKWLKIFPFHEKCMRKIGNHSFNRGFNHDSGLKSK